MGSGQFSGNPRTEWLSGDAGDRGMRLVEPFWFVDPQGRRWDAPAGSATDGATIPRTLWAYVGSPYTGPYRRAAIVHDVAIRDPLVVRAEADAMFYHACLAGGCSARQAGLLYAGVCLGSWLEQSPAQADAARLPGELSPGELEVRALYTLIAADLRSAGTDFASVRAAVARHLGAPAR
ncbi:MAG: DUF1353 domain-containing protein [Telluria sp.]